MDNDTFKKALGEIKNIRLSRGEKSFILEKILHGAVNPVRELTQGVKLGVRTGKMHTAASRGAFSNGVKSPYWSPYSIVAQMRQSKLYAFSFAIILLVSGGGSIVLAAESSVPGDILYPIKVKVTEPALDKIFVTTKENARWQGEKTVRRLREAETLALQGRLDEEKSKAIEEKIKEHGEEFHAVIRDLSTTTESEQRESVEVEYESKVRAHSKILSKIREGYSEETKSTIEYVEKTLDKELQRNQEREEERGREMREKKREKAEITEDDLNKRLEDAEESIETVAENIKKERVNLIGLRGTISEAILEESDKIIQETLSKLSEARKIRGGGGDTDEEETISDIEDSEQKVLETNTMLKEIKKVDRPKNKKERNKRENNREKRKSED